MDGDAVARERARRVRRHGHRTAAGARRRPAIRPPEGTVPHAAAGDEGRAGGRAGQSHDLQEEMSYFAELVKELDRLQRNAASLLGGLGDQGGLGMRRGPTPAVAECVLGLRDLWRIHRDELFAKRALVDELTCDAAMPDLEDVKALFAAEANLDPDAVRRLVDSILDATPDPQSRRRQ
jgi:hypothetical protein